jgi:hypothetical protein
LVDRDLFGLSPDIADDLDASGRIDEFYRGPVSIPSTMLSLVATVDPPVVIIVPAAIAIASSEGQTNEADSCRHAWSF